ncbi:MAG: hypothetical protein KIT45_09255 [Fimbriimonadia bacterium]|nr:hypothetical protein [Fimbriimonadia bacterium]
MNIGDLTGLFAVMMPVFIVGIIVTAIFLPKFLETRYQYRQRLLELEVEKRRLDGSYRSLTGDAKTDGEARNLLQALQKELSELRSTSTEYDMSIHVNMEEMRERIRHLEQQVLQLQSEQRQQVQ